MNRILTVFFLMLMPLSFVFAEDSIVFSDIESEKNQEELLENSLIERVKALAKAYARWTAEEKEEFLAEAGITEKAFKCLQAQCELDWKTEGRHQLPLSNSTISIPNGYALVTGSDAVAFYTIEGEPVNEGLEGYVCERKNFDNPVLFQNDKVGYISLDDWEEIDAKDLLDGIVQNTEKANMERIKRGLAEVHVKGWIQEPTLNRNTHTVYWAIEANSGEDENFVNSVALRLGREGYETLTWITSLSSYIPFGGHLDTMLGAHSFDPGYRYEDYKAGDKLAEYGIATLVAASLGGKLLKGGGIALILKKFGGLLFAGITAAFYKFRNLFTRKKDA